MPISKKIKELIRPQTMKIDTYIITAFDSCNRMQQQETAVGYETALDRYISLKRKYPQSEIEVLKTTLTPLR